PVPALKRTHALGIPCQVRSDLPPIDGPVLVATANCLVHSSDVRRCIDTQSRLLSSTGEPLTLGVLDSTDATPDSVLDALDEVPALRANGVAHRVNDPKSASVAERALWSSLTTSADGLVDKFFN